MNKKINLKDLPSTTFMHYEAYPIEKLARMREKRLKYNGNAIRELKKRILESGAGFTLIELMVVLSIIAILSMLGIASFVNYNRSQTVDSAANDFATVLNLAKSRALSQVKPSSCAVTTALDGYEVRLCGGVPACISGNPNTNYELDVRCTGNYYNVSFGTFPQNVSFAASPTPPTSIFFPVLTGGVSWNGTIGITGFSQTKNVIIDTNGNISIQ